MVHCVYIDNAAVCSQTDQHKNCGTQLGTFALPSPSIDLYFHLVCETNEFDEILVVIFIRQWVLHV